MKCHRTRDASEGSSFGSYLSQSPSIRGVKVVSITTKEPQASEVGLEQVRFCVYTVCPTSAAIPSSNIRWHLKKGYCCLLKTFVCTKILPSSQWDFPLSFSPFPFEALSVSHFDVYLHVFKDHACIILIFQV